MTTEQIIFSIISAIAGIASSVAAIFMWIISKKLYNLQKSIEDSKKTLVHIWSNSNKNLTLINLGKQSLPIRTLRLLEGKRSSYNRNIDFTLIKAREENDQEPKLFLSNRDILLIHEKIYNLNLKQEQLQMTFEVMYYDNSFEFVEIDTSNLGGKYILTGIGTKPL